MDDKKALEIADKIFANVFGVKNPFSLNELLTRFAFDVKLPVKVQDSTTGEDTWAESINPTRFISQKNAEKRDNWMLEKRPVKSIDDLLKIWHGINYMTTERSYDSTDISESDTIYASENIFRSANCFACKNTLFSDGCNDSEFLLACQRSANTNFGIRVDDSSGCSNSYNVVCSKKITSSLIIQDCALLHECILCSHIANHRYCIANMQFEKDEYLALKPKIIEWILTS
jgi:hypothetical protein